MFVFFNIEVCSNQALAPWVVLKSLPLVPARPDYGFGIQAGGYSAEGNNFNTAL